MLRQIYSNKFNFHTTSVLQVAITILVMLVLFMVYASFIEIRTIRSSLIKPFLYYEDRSYVYDVDTQDDQMMIHLEGTVTKFDSFVTQYAFLVSDLGRGIQCPLPVITRANLDCEVLGNCGEGFFATDFPRDISMCRDFLEEASYENIYYLHATVVVANEGDGDALINPILRLPVTFVDE